MPLDEKPIDTVKPETAPPDVADQGAADEVAEDADDAGDETADDDTSGIIDTLDDDDAGESEPAKANADKRDASLSVVPKDASGYKIPKIEGLELTDADKPALQGFMEHAAKVGANQAAINAGLGYYQELKAAQVQLDATTSKQAKAELIGELGADEFRAETGRLKNALRSMPEGLGKDILEARLPDGRKLINDPRYFRWMQGQNARTRVPTTSDRIAEIEKVMKSDIQRYRSEGLSEEYAKLLARREAGR